LPAQRQNADAINRVIKISGEAPVSGDGILGLEPHGASESQVQKGTAAPASG
jgi:hypothetical protein